MLDDKQLDRAVGAVLGSAVGDALGAGYEFGTRAKPGPEGPQMIGGGLGDFEPGEWTDDTSMAWCVLDAAARGHDLRSDEGLTTVARSFRTWYESHPPDMGGQTRTVLRGGGEHPTADALLAASERFHERTGRSAGNGSLMRTAAVALPHLGDVEVVRDAARRVSALTHWDAQAQDGCALWSLAINHAILYGELDLRRGLLLLDAEGAAYWSERIDEAEQRPAASFDHNTWVVTALQAAWSAIVQTPVPADDPGRHYRDALRTVIEVGNDTDTTAAIAGALLGARWGASAVPREWREMAHGYPGLTGDDLVRLAHAAVGEADHQTADVRSDEPATATPIRTERTGHTERTDALMDRAAGALLAAACGDALGVPYEFEKRVLGATDEPEMVGGGLGPYEPGEWSDDTQMAIVIAQAAAAGDLRDEQVLDRIAEGWIGWMRDGASDMGNQTLSVLTTAVRWGDPEGAGARTRLAAQELHERTGHTAGNGSLMRTGPVALAFLDDPEGCAEAARKISDLTHGDPIAGDACVLWSEAIRQAIVTGADVDLAAIARTLPEERRADWLARIEAAETTEPRAYNPNGFAPIALQAAWSAITHPWPGDHHNPLTGSLVAAVHAGNDTDTVAAIAGAYLGARWGAQGLPQRWLDDVHGWPGLDAAALRELAASIVRRGAQPTG